MVGVSDEYGDVLCCADAQC